MLAVAALKLQKKLKLKYLVEGRINLGERARAPDLSPRVMPALRQRRKSQTVPSCNSYYKQLSADIKIVQNTRIDRKISINNFRNSVKCLQKNDAIQLNDQS